jgi:protoporphyrin/coproporphyrin ferrochelatase
VTSVGVVVMAHGTPHALEDLRAFYTEIRRGHPPSPEQLADLESRYRAIGGISPLNERTAGQLAGIRLALEARAPARFTVEAGAKFSDPRIENAVAVLASRGVQRLVGLVLTPHYSAVGVGEYARRARAAADEVGLRLTMIEHWHLASGFVAVTAARVRAALASLEERDLDAARDAVVVFTAHSIPARLVEEGDPYQAQVHETARAVAHAAGTGRWSVAWQSAGRTSDEWLGPDIRQEIGELGATGASAVVVCPIGFVSDHLEVLYDLDVEAKAAAHAAGIGFARTESLNDDPKFCDVVAKLIVDATSQSDR